MTCSLCFCNNMYISLKICYCHFCIDIGNVSLVYCNCVLTELVIVIIFMMRYNDAVAVVY